MKKVIAAVLICMLLLSLCGCTARQPDETVAEKPAQTDNNSATSGALERPEIEFPSATPVPASGTDISIPEMLTEEALASLTALQQQIADGEYACGVAFLGYVVPDVSIPESLAMFDVFSDRGSSEAFPFLNEMTPEQCPGSGFSELFCLVPAPGDSSVVIEESEVVDGEATGKIINEVYRSKSGEPVLFTAESNGWGGGNIVVTVECQYREKVSFQPCMWSNLGILAVPEDVLDFTVYEEGSREWLLVNLAGEWAGKNTVDGVLTDFWLTLGRNGEVLLDVKEDGSLESLREYQGWWSTGSGEIYLFLTLSGGTEYDETSESEEIAPVYEVELEDGFLLLSLTDGESPISGLGALEMSRAYG